LLKYKGLIILPGIRTTKLRCITLVTLFCFLLLANILCAEATVIGANKGVINFKNVLKNGYAQEAVTLTAGTDFNLSITYKVEGDIADWIRLEPAEQPFFVNKDMPKVVLIIVEPPPDAKNQLYNATIRFLTGALAGPEGQFGTAVRAAINIRAGLEIVGQEIVSCSASEFALSDVEEGYPFEFYSVVTNNGNVRITPEFILEFWNQDQTVLVKTFKFTLNESILPTAEKRIFYSFSQDMEIGQYWVKISTPLCKDSGNGFLTTSVIERGGVSDYGELVNIENDPWVKSGSIVPIDAVFKNLGSRVVSAKFKGTISSGEDLVKIIDTDPLDVMPGETTRIRTYFNPTQESQYIIKGRVLYNKKLTFEKSSVVNVNAAGEKPGGGAGIQWSTILIILTVIIILIILIIIRKRKLKRSR
jgi:hypothetical protein